MPITTALTHTQSQIALATVTKNGQPCPEAVVQAYSSAPNVVTVERFSANLLEFTIVAHAPGVATITFVGPGSTSVAVDVTVRLADDEYTLTIELGTVYRPI